MKKFSDLINETKIEKEYISISVDGNCVWSSSVNIPPYVNWDDKDDVSVKKFSKEMAKAVKQAEKEMTKLSREGFSPMKLSEPCWTGTR